MSDTGEGKRPLPDAERLDRLEQRVAALEAKVDAVLEMATFVAQAGVKLVAAGCGQEVRLDRLESRLGVEG